MLGYVYGKGQVLSTNQDLGVKVATPVGTIFGQLIFGWLADHVGRKRMCKYRSFCDSLLLMLMYTNRWRRVDYHYHRLLWSSVGGGGAFREHHCGHCPMALHREL